MLENWVLKIYPRSGLGFKHRLQLDNTVEGLIRLAEINDDFYIYDDLNKQLIGKETKKVYKLGQKVKIEVVFADKQTRKIDFKLL